MLKELRDATGMTQKEFANRYGRPLSTLRKWEQGESSPAPYVLNLLAQTIPNFNGCLQQIRGTGENVYYYDPLQKTVTDKRGNTILIQEDLESVKTQNLVLYLQELFESFYEIQDKFNRDCKYDKEEDILWSRGE